jgi:deoxyribodipyrimidine photo-lyase
MQPTTIFWFRRDLRLHDNAAFYKALKHNKAVQPIFIFDKNILNKLADKADARVSFLYQTINHLKNELQALGSDLKVYYDTPLNVFTQINTTTHINAVYTNTDYEGYAIQRDNEIKNVLFTKNIDFKTFKDHVIFDTNEVTKDDGLPYTVFTPYSKKWKAKLTPYHYKAYPNQKYFSNLIKVKNEPLISLIQMGFTPSSIHFPGTELNEQIAAKYTQQRDFPAINGTSKLGLHLRFGTISIRALAAKALTLNETFLNELIWRDFYHQITYHFTHINNGLSFKTQYDAIQWRNNEDEFKAWCNGVTGYPIVDAGMRELNATGYMHNRVRMIVASFLCKHLLIDWRWGEAYFAQKLLDFDFAANNGGWQWASSSGCDAAPYFRVFNPTLQTQKFDSKLEYIRKWVPELDDFTKYPQPIVNHEMARKRVLEVYKQALS